MTLITKASGETVPFDERKLRRSLARVGAGDQLIDRITDEVTQSLTEGMTTHAIYRLAFRLLRRESKTLGAKYHLKNAIMQLGTSGYPFEKYVAELLHHQGYQCQNNQYVQGRCVDHEVDVVAKGKDNDIYVECKYHNRRGLKCDVKVTLYFRGRMIDIEQARTKRSPGKIIGMIVTNTRFSNDAVQYGECVGLRLIGWDYPETGSLKEWVEVSGLYPITCITSLTKNEIAQLMANRIVLCRTLKENPQLLDTLRIPKPRRHSILQQCHTLCEK